MIIRQSRITYMNGRLIFEFDKRNANRLNIIKELHYSRHCLMIMITLAHSLEITFCKRQGFQCEQNARGGGTQQMLG